MLFHIAPGSSVLATAGVATGAVVVVEHDVPAIKRAAARQWDNFV